MGIEVLTATAAACRQKRIANKGRQREKKALGMCGAGGHSALFPVAIRTGTIVALYRKVDGSERGLRFTIILFAGPQVRGTIATIALLQGVKMSADQVPSAPPPLGFADRRANHRYAVSLELTYRLLKGDRSGIGRTLDISSRGLCCAGMGPLAPGTWIELSLNWPIRLDNGCPLKMLVVGPVLRSDAGSTAIAIDTHRFHTRRRIPNLERGNSAEAPQVA
jgi:hypothetical protein